MRLKNDVYYLVQWKKNSEGALEYSLVQPYNGHLYDYTGEWYCDEDDVLRAVEMDKVVKLLDELNLWTNSNME